MTARPAGATDTDLGPLAFFYLFIFCLYAYLHIRLSGYAADDAYIHFRIAENLLGSGVPYYNTDEAVMASSSSAWTLALAALFAVAGASVKAVGVMNAAVSVAGCYVFARFAGEFSGVRGLRVHALAAAVYLPLVADSSLSLMETPLGLLLLGGAALLYARGSASSFLLFGAGVFVRPELAVFPAVFLGAGVLLKSVLPLRAAAWGLAGAAPFILYNMYFFGTNIPHAVMAKSLVYTLAASEVLSAAFPAPPPLHGLNGVTAWLAAFLAVCVMAVFRTVRRKHSPPAAAVLCLALGGLAVVSAYLMKGVLVFPWYRPLYVVPVLFAGLACVLNMRSFPLVAAMVVALAPSLHFTAMSAYASVADISAYPNFAYEARVARFMELGRELERKYPGASVMSSEIGGLGFGFGGRVYDGVGLLSDGPLRYHPMSVPEQRERGYYGSVPAGYFEEVRPDIVVGLDVYLKDVLGSKSAGDYIIMKEDAYTEDDMSRAGPHADGARGRVLVMIRGDVYDKGETR